MQMTPERWEYTRAYTREVFGAEDAHLAGLMDEAVKAGLPDISVSPDVGRLLHLLTSLTRGRLALEFGTLAGYSAIWIARGLGEGGRLITVESEPAHADFAEAQLARAGVRERVSVRRGKALEVLPGIADEVGPGSVDLVFLDAVKAEYPDYLRLVRPLVAPGGLLIADNVLGAGAWWIDDEDNASRRAVDAFNRAIAGDPDFEAACVPLREGLVIARRVR